MPVVVGPVAEGDVEVVDEHERLAGPGPDPGDHGREVVPAPGGRAGDADHPADPGRRAGALHRGDQRGASAPGAADDEQVPVGGGRPDGTLVTLALGLVGQPDDERARRDRTRARPDVEVGGREPIGQATHPGATGTRERRRRAEEALDLDRLHPARTGTGSDDRRRGRRRLVRASRVRWPPRRRSRPPRGCRPAASPAARPGSRSSPRPAPARRRWAAATRARGARRANARAPRCRRRRRRARGSARSSPGTRRRPGRGGPAPPGAEAARRRAPRPRRAPTPGAAAPTAGSASRAPPRPRRGRSRCR